MRCKPSGPLDAKIMLIGEAPGAEEARLGKPFVGYSGEELRKILAEVGVDPNLCYMTNVFLDRPLNNKFHDEWCVTKKGAEVAYEQLREELVATHPEIDWPTKYTWKAVSAAKYVSPEHLPEVFRLRKEIELVHPNIVICLGATSMWAVLGHGGIKKLRGTVTETDYGQKVLSTYHPAYIMRAYENRLTMLVDLKKAVREAAYPEIRKPKRKVYIAETISDITYFYMEFLLKDIDLLAFDTETAHKKISCISFAPNEKIALTIPFLDKSKPGYNYWSTLEEEVAAWDFVALILSSDVPKLAQNGLYDLQYLWAAHGIPVRNYAEDTMLLHHALYLELPKDLGYLGSVYTEEAAWKMMRSRERDNVEKKDD